MQQWTTSNLGVVLILLVAALAIFEVAAFYALLKGSFELRRNLGAASHDLSSVCICSSHGCVFRNRWGGSSNRELVHSRSGPMVAGRTKPGGDMRSRIWSGILAAGVFAATLTVAAQEPATSQNPGAPTATSRRRAKPCGES